MKKAYVSPREGELSVSITPERVTLMLDLGIPNFSIFSLAFPILDIAPDDVRHYAGDALEALLDEVGGFMLSLGYPENVIVALYQVVRECFRDLSFSESTDARMSDHDTAVQLIEKSFELGEDFVQETQERVITAAQVVKRVPKIRHLDLVPFPPRARSEPVWVIELFKDRALRQGPRPHFVRVDERLLSKPQIRARDWEQRLIKAL